MDLLLLFYFLGVVAMQFTAVQTEVGHQLTQYFEKELDADIKLEKVRITWFNRLVVDDLYISDLQKDTLIYSREIDLGFDLYDLLHFHPRVQSICLTRPVVYLEKTAEDATFNYQFLVDYFSSGDTSQAFTLLMDHLEILNGRIYVDQDPLKKNRNHFDPEKLNIENFHLYVSGLHIQDGVIRLGHIETSFEEKAFILEELTASAVISEKQIDIRDLFISTPFSEIHGSLRLKSDDWSSYDHFEREVHMSAHFLPSDLSMRDLSFFIPDLKGMKDIPHFSGDFSGNIADLKGKDVELSLEDHSSIELDFEIAGLPDFEKTYFLLDIQAVDQYQEWY